MIFDPVICLSYTSALRLDLAYLIVCFMFINVYRVFYITFLSVTDGSAICQIIRFVLEQCQELKSPVWFWEHFLSS